MDEEIFRKGVACLKEANLNFWANCGTLLGLIREGGIIAWDGDFDLGVWDHETTEEELIKAFDPEEFRVVSLVPYGKKGFFFLPRDERLQGKLDISFYTRQGNRAIFRSCTTKDTLWTDLIKRTGCFLDPHIHAKEKYKHLLEEAFHKGLPSCVKNRLARGLDYLMRRNYLNGIPLTYDFPAHYFENLRPVTFLGVEVNIPADAEGYLELAYGKDWRIPKQWTHWWEGATYIDGKKNI
ncbi:MAG: LicD family protein [Syntrophobacteraceae bacterium]|jgi:phosphorylcholine metabolism protein LicD